MTSPRYTWKKAEKLKSRKRIDQVFREGKSFSLFPYRVYYIVSPATPPAATVQAGFSAPRRHFKKAVDRNRIKRLGREAYRLHKQPLILHCREKAVSLALFFIYTGKEISDYPTVREKITVALQKLVKEIK